MIFIWTGISTSKSGNGTLQSMENDKENQFAPTVLVVLIACLCGTILILLIIIGVCLVRRPPAYGNSMKSKSEPNSSHVGDGNYYVSHYTLRENLYKQ